MIAVVVLVKRVLELHCIDASAQDMQAQRNCAMLHGEALMDFLQSAVCNASSGQW